MCDKNIKINENNTFSFWENHDTSKDEKEIIQYLLTNKYPISPKTKILHVGIGNGTFPAQIKSNIDGITISKLEKNHANKNNYYNNIHICNKYNIPMMNQKLSTKYDIIIDPNIKSYTCCQVHFEELFNFYLNILTGTGIIITSKLGMNWSGYDVFSKIKTNALIKGHKDTTNQKNKNRLLLQELIDLAKKQNYVISENKDFPNTLIIHK